MIPGSSKLGQTPGKGTNRGPGELQAFRMFGDGSEPRGVGRRTGTVWVQFVRGGYVIRVAENGDRHRSAR